VRQCAADGLITQAFDMLDDKYPAQPPAGAKAAATSARPELKKEPPTDDSTIPRDNELAASGTLTRMSSLRDRNSFPAASDHGNRRHDEIGPRRLEGPFRRHSPGRNCVISSMTKHELTWIKIG
jgi:hypothetical protein